MIISGKLCKVIRNNFLCLIPKWIVKYYNFKFLNLTISIPTKIFSWNTCINWQFRNKYTPAIQIVRAFILRNIILLNEVIYHNFLFHCVHWAWLTILYCKYHHKYISIKFLQFFLCSTGQKNTQIILYYCH